MRRLPVAPARHSARTALLTLLALCALVPTAGRPGAAARAEEPAATRLTAAELEELVAPVALYPDPVLAALLPATTDPLGVVELARWVEAQPGAITEVPAELGVGEDVAALVQFPDVLAWMNQNLGWVQSLGWAVANQMEDVLQAIQTFRGKAVAAGALVSSEKLSVETKASPTTGAQVIVIECPQPEVVYVPVYDPVTVVQPAAPGLAFATGVAVGVAGAWLWHELVWDDWHVVHHVGGPRWSHSDIDVDVNVGDVNVGNRVNVGNGSGNRAVRWQPAARPGSPALRPPSGRAPRPTPYRPPAGAPRRPAAPGGVRPTRPSTQPVGGPGRGGPGGSDLGRTPTPAPSAPAFAGGDRGAGARDDSRRGQESLHGGRGGPPPSTQPAPSRPSGPERPGNGAPPSTQPVPSKPAVPERPAPAPAPSTQPARTGGAFGGAGAPSTRRASERGNRSLRPTGPSR